MPQGILRGEWATRGSALRVVLWLLLVLAAAAGGFYAGRVLPATPAGLSVAAMGGKLAITEDELDAPVATYTYEGEDCQVTAREAIAQASSLDAVRNSDGTYAMPSAESVISAARMAIVAREVEARGITVSDDELTAYVSETFGTEDIAGMAAAYGMDEETLRARLVESAGMAKLRAEVVGVPATEPEEPSTPEKGKEREAKKEYADYIIALAGDEWDAEGDVWASYDGPYASALKEYDVRNDGASYEAAQVAYTVAIQLRSEGSTSASTQWTAYINGLLAKADLHLASLVS